MCHIEGYIYVNNDNITRTNLFKDGLLLLDTGKQILADNFAFTGNRNFLMFPKFHPNVHLTAVWIKQYTRIVMNTSHLILKNFEMLGWVTVS